jgi:hypothetical protein
MRVSISTGRRHESRCGLPGRTFEPPRTAASSKGPARQAEPTNMVRPLLLLRCLDDHAAHVVAALGAHNMLRDGLAALGAVGKLLGLFSVVSPAPAGSRVGLAALWNCHRSLNLGQIHEPSLGLIVSGESRIVKLASRAVNRWRPRVRLGELALGAYFPSFAHVWHLRGNSLANLAHPKAAFYATFSTRDGSSFAAATRFLT